jgi:hypothetical protein
MLAAVSRPPRALVAIVMALSGTAACQAGMSTTPSVTPLPANATGLSVFLAPEPTIVKLEDSDARPVAIALQHDIRDVLEEAGFKLAATPEAAGGVVVSLVIQRVGIIHADLFIHGSEACGVRLDVARGAAVVATAQPEVECVATSAYYGMLPKDTAVTLVNAIAHAPAVVAAADLGRLKPPAGAAPLGRVASDGGATDAGK